MKQETSVQVNRETLLLYHSCVIIEDILADTESGRTEPKKKYKGGKLDLEFLSLLYSFSQLLV